MTTFAEMRPGANGAAGASGAPVVDLSAWERLDWRSLPRPELMAAQRRLAAARNQLTMLASVAAAEIARRSTGDDGAAGLARREGFRTPEELIAATTGGTRGEAARLIAVGSAVRVDDAGVGFGVAPPQRGARWPEVAAAMRAGTLSVDAANLITGMLERLGDAVAPEALSAAERELVAKAPGLSADRLAGLVKRMEARLDARSLAEREARLREARYLSIVERRDGSIAIDARLDPETGAPVKIALEALVGEALRRRQDVNAAGVGSGSGAGSADCRTLPQVRADALADLARHALGCEGTARTQPIATVVVRMSLDDMQAGIGVAEIDGLDQPVSIEAARRMCADAEVIPLVLGGESEVLDLGRARRLFSRGQKIALVERDGGCAWCHAPPAWCEAHHIRWWERDSGKTDIDNGVLLCTSCHHRLHRDGWEVRATRARVEMIPPASVNPTRKPVPAGRERFGVAVMSALAERVAA